MSERNELEQLRASALAIIEKKDKQIELLWDRIDAAEDCLGAAIRAAAGETPFEYPALYNRWIETKLEMLKDADPA